MTTSHRSAVASLARELMNLHGLGHWTFEWDRAKRRVGRCSYVRKTISLSIHYVDQETVEVLRNTILHEIAHALVGHEAGHGPVWKAKAREIGCRPERCNTVVTPVPGKWVGMCPTCGPDVVVVEWHRMPKCNYLCRRHRVRLVVIPR